MTVEDGRIAGTVMFEWALGMTYAIPFSVHVGLSLFMVFYAFLWSYNLFDQA